MRCFRVYSCGDTGIHYHTDSMAFDRSIDVTTVKNSVKIEFHVEIQLAHCALIAYNKHLRSLVEWQGFYRSYCLGPMTNELLSVGTKNKCVCSWMPIHWGRQPSHITHSPAHALTKIEESLRILITESHYKIINVGHQFYYLLVGCVGYRSHTRTAHTSCHRRRKYI